VIVWFAVSGPVGGASPRRVGVRAGGPLRGRMRPIRGRSRPIAADRGPRRGPRGPGVRSGR